VDLFFFKENLVLRKKVPKCSYFNKLCTDIFLNFSKKVCIIFVSKWSLKIFPKKKIEIEKEKQKKNRKGPRGTLSA
jgi:hypothetical protein